MKLSWPTCLPFFPPVRAFIFDGAQGAAFPRFVDFHVASLRCCAFGNVRTDPVRTFYEQFIHETIALLASFKVQTRRGYDPVLVEGKEARVKAKMPVPRPVAMGILPTPVVDTEVTRLVLLRERCPLAVTASPGSLAMAEAAMVVEGGEGGGDGGGGEGLGGGGREDGGGGGGEGGGEGGKEKGGEQAPHGEGVAPMACTPDVNDGCFPAVDGDVEVGMTESEGSGSAARGEVVGAAGTGGSATSTAAVAAVVDEAVRTDQEHGATRLPSSSSPTEVNGGEAPVTVDAMAAAAAAEATGGGGGGARWKGSGIKRCYDNFPGPKRRMRVYCFRSPPGEMDGWVPTPKRSAEKAKGSGREKGEGKKGDDDESKCEDGGSKEAEDDESKKGEEVASMTVEDGESRKDEDGDSKKGEDDDSKNGEGGESKKGEDGESIKGEDGESKKDEDGDIKKGEDDESKKGEDGESKKDEEGESMKGEDDGSRQGEDGERKNDEDGESKNDEDGESRKGEDGESKKGKDGESKKGSDEEAGVDEEEDEDEHEVRASLLELIQNGGRGI